MLALFNSINNAIIDFCSWLLLLIGAGFTAAGNFVSDQWYGMADHSVSWGLDTLIGSYGGQVLPDLVALLNQAPPQLLEAWQYLGVGQDLVSIITAVLARWSTKLVLGARG